MLNIFKDVGVPELIRTDGALSFTSRQFREFLGEWGIVHQTSSPHYPRSNGLAESAVKSVKKLLRRCWDNGRGRLNEKEWTRGLIQQRNTPGVSGKSPAEIVYGRPMRDDLPTHPSHFSRPSRLQSATDDEGGRDAASRHRATHGDPRHDDPCESRRSAAKRWYDRHARDLPEFPVGTRVRVQDVRTRRWDRCGVVVHVGQFRRYRVRFDDAGEVERNRCHLRKRYALYPVPMSSMPSDPRGKSRPAAVTPATGRDQPAPARPDVARRSRAARSETQRGTALPRRSTRIRKPVRRLIEEM